MNRIREVRKSRGLTMKELGKMVGCSESTISVYETGKHEPDNQMLLKLSEVLDASIDYLLGKTEEKKETNAPRIAVMLRAMEKMTPEQQKTMIDLGKAAFAKYFDIPTDDESA